MENKATSLGIDYSAIASYARIAMALAVQERSSWPCGGASIDHRCVAVTTSVDYDDRIRAEGLDMFRLRWRQTR